MNELLYCSSVLCFLLDRVQAAQEMDFGWVVFLIAGAAVWFNLWSKGR